MENMKLRHDYMNIRHQRTRKHEVMNMNRKIYTYNMVEDMQIRFENMII